MTAVLTKNLLIVWHSRTGTARQMAQAAVQGAQAALQELQAEAAVKVNCLPAGDCQPDNVLHADGFLFCAPENLASLSGEMKEFFDRNYYAVLDHIEGRPYGAMIAAGSDGAGAMKQVERIATGWRLRRALPSLIVNTGAQSPQAILAPKQLTDEQRRQCEEMGGTLAALLAGFG